jgi:hypothetical protein
MMLDFCVSFSFVVKYWSKKTTNENKAKARHAKKGARWLNENDKNNYDLLDQDSENEGNKDELYAGRYRSVFDDNRFSMIVN